MSARGKQLVEMALKRYTEYGPSTSNNSSSSGTGTDSSTSKSTQKVPGDSNSNNCVSTGIEPVSFTVNNYISSEVRADPSTSNYDISSGIGPVPSTSNNYMSCTGIEPGPSTSKNFISSRIEAGPSTLNYSISNEIRPDHSTFNNDIPSERRQSSCSEISSDAPSIPIELEEQFDVFHSDNDDRDPDFLPESDDSLASSDSNITSQITEKKEAEVNIQRDDNEEVREMTEDASKKKLGEKRKRVFKETRKIREERQLKRNKGEEYVTKKNKVITAKTMKELKLCRNKCREKFNNDVRSSLFDDFWSMNSYNRRTQYISDLIILEDKKVTRLRKQESNKNRTCSALYYFRINNSLKRTCKDCFKNTFDVTNKFLEIIFQRKKHSNISGVIELDRRGIHANRNKITDEHKETARQHILSIPTYESHYTRRQSSKRYLPPHFTLASLYQNYQKKYPTDFINRRAYEEIFYSLNIKIKQPKKDTCCTCDKLQMKLKMSKCEDETVKIKQELAEHHQKADRGYTAKNDNKNISKLDVSKKTISFDLQQCLPTPDLQSGETFYKRQLWTYNLTVHDCDDGQAYCYLWYETLAKRGGNEIGSCIYRYLTKDLHSTVSHVVMYSDSCGRQNKNCYISATCLVALQDCKNLEVIDHKFILPGHTHMECDTDHSLIEKKKKTCNLKVEHPHDWAQLISLVGKKKPFQVCELERTDFLNFSGLFSTSLVNRKQNTEGGKLNWREVRWIRYKKNTKSLYYKNSLDENETFKLVDLEKKGRTCKEMNLIPKKAYDEPVPISTEKKKHLMDLLPYISEGNWDFYKNLKTINQVDIYPDASSEDE